MTYQPTKKSTPRLVRSNTRITVLEWCERKYYLNYYTFALKDSHPEIRLQAHILKGLKSLQMRIGEKTHYLLSDYLHYLKEAVLIGQPITATGITTFKEQMRTEMETEFTLSKERDYTDSTDFYKRFWLSEHFYGENIDNQLQPAIEKVLTNFDHFIESVWNEKIKDHLQMANVIYIEYPRVPNFEAMKVNVSNIPGLEQVLVLASPDFWIIFADTNYLILDRKSWKEDILKEGISDQLKVYALKRLLKKGIISLNENRIETYEIFLNTMNTHGGIISQTDIDYIIEKFKKDVDYQKQFIQDQDPIKNLPLDLLVFRKTSNKKKCESCTFRDVCKKLK